MKSDELLLKDLIREILSKESITKRKLNEAYASEEEKYAAYKDLFSKFGISNSRQMDVIRSRTRNTAKMSGKPEDSSFLAREISKASGERKLSDEDKEAVKNLFRDLQSKSTSDIFSSALSSKPKSPSSDKKSDNSSKPESGKSDTPEKPPEDKRDEKKSGETKAPVNRREEFRDAGFDSTIEINSRENRQRGTLGALVSVGDKSLTVDAFEDPKTAELFLKINKENGAEFVRLLGNVKSSQDRDFNMKRLDIEIKKIEPGGTFSKEDLEKFSQILSLNVEDKKTEPESKQSPSGSPDKSQGAKTEPTKSTPAGKESSETKPASKKEEPKKPEPPKSEQPKTSSKPEPPKPGETKKEEPKKPEPPKPEAPKSPEKKTEPKKVEPENKEKKKSEKEKKPPRLTVKEKAKNLNIETSEFRLLRRVIKRFIATFSDEDKAILRKFSLAEIRRFKNNRQLLSRIFSR